MTSRWCNARQLAIDNARALIDSEECTYRIKKSEKVSDADVVEKLLDDEAFHLGKTNSVSDLPTVNRSRFTNLLSGCPEQGSSIPLQHPEIASCLSRFFRGRNSYGMEYSAQFPKGRYGHQMPEAIVALVTTAVRSPRRTPIPAN